MPLLQLTEQARSDIDNIYDYIGEREARPATAERLVTDLVETCRSYAKLFSQGSMLGTEREDLGESVRVFSFKRWVVVFRPIEDGIEVVRVVDGSRDFGRLFGH